MPSIAEAIQANQQRIAAGGDTATGAAPSQAPTPQNLVSIPAPPQLDLPIGLPQRGVFPANIVLASDRSANSREFRDMGMRSSTFPYPPAQPTNTKIVVASSSQSSGTVAASLKILFNNVPSPNQHILNLISGKGIQFGVDSFGGLTITSNATSDGITHGDVTDWWNDAAFAFWRDDFNTGNALSTASSGFTGIGELGWSGFVGTNAQSSRTNGGFYNPGLLNIITGTTINQFSSIYWPNGITSPAQQATQPFADYAGWKMVWVFGFPNRTSPAVTIPFPLAAKQFYCGLTSTVNNTSNGGWAPNNGLTARPAYGMVLRFDTDPGKTYALTSVANHTGGTTTYTGSALTITPPELIGSTITISGFSNAPNNGQFFVVATTSTTITVLSAVGIAETATASAVTPPISDTTFKFESVSNPNYPINNRINTHGTVVDTGIVPVEGSFYRLEMLCTIPGQVTMTLTGGLRGAGATFTSPMNFIGTTSFLGGAGGIGSLLRQNGVASITGANSTSPFNPNVNGMSAVLLTSGSKVTVSSAPSAYNGSFTVTDVGNDVFIYGPVPAGTSSGDAGTVTYFPGLLPYFGFGNDSQNSAVSNNIAVDFFSLVWNPGIAGASLVALNPRYF